MAKVRVPDQNDRSSVSAEDMDSSMLGKNHADAETERINQWTRPSFAQRGRHQSALDSSFGFPVKGGK